MKALNLHFLSSFLLTSLFLHANANLYPRQSSASLSLNLPITTPSSSASSSSSTTASESSSSSSSSPSSSSSTSSSTSSITTSATSQITSAPPTTTSSSQSVQLSLSNGVEVTVTVTGTSTSSSASASSSSAADNHDSSSGLGTGSIVGMAVAGGIAVIGIIAFFVWKFTRKRFSDFDDNEAIKWPDLNTHGAGASDSHPLPVHNTGRAGFDTGSEGSLSRVPSNNYSTPDFGSNGPDPYAVPPLPHLNPNQPYRDDPGATAGYYDPYRGPVPGTIEHSAAGGQDWGGEAIPMTQMNATGRMSPGPHAAYGTEPAYEYDAGRQSPAPQAAYGGGRTSPGPQAAYGGRTSPGPQAAYGGRTSPGPQAAYGGRVSPGPQAAYGGLPPTGNTGYP